MKQPNILFIIADQHSPRGMCWTGTSPAITPTLDQLAAGGTAFTSAITPNPVCGPARYCFYTGQYSSSNGVLINEAEPKPFVPLAEHLRRAGYATANVGKLHATPFHERLGFDYCLNHEFFMNPAGISHYDAFLRAQCAERGIEHQGFGPGGSDGRSWLESAAHIAFENWLPEDLTPERWTTDQSLEYMRQHKENYSEQPFFLHASYFPPHHPFAPIKKFLDQIPEDIPLPPNFAIASKRQDATHPQPYSMARAACHASATNFPLASTAVQSCWKEIFRSQQLAGFVQVDSFNRTLPAESDQFKRLDIPLRFRRRHPSSPSSRARPGGAAACPQDTRQISPWANRPGCGDRNRRNKERTVCRGCAR